MGTKTKRRRRKREQEHHEHHRAAPINLPKFSRLQVLVAFLAVSSVSAFVLFKMNTKEETTEISAEEMELKKQMMDTFMQKQAGSTTDAATGPAASTPAPTQ